MSNKSKAIGLGMIVLCLSTLIFFIVIKSNDNLNNDARDNYTVQWEYKEGETVQLKNTDLLYDDNNRPIKPSSSDDQGSYYNLAKGEYTLKTKIILNNEPIEIRIIVY